MYNLYQFENELHGQLKSLKMTSFDNTIKNKQREKNEDMMANYKARLKLFINEMKSKPVVIGEFEDKKGSYNFRETDNSKMLSQQMTFALSQNSEIAPQNSLHFKPSLYQKIQNKQILARNQELKLNKLGTTSQLKEINIEGSCNLPENLQLNQIEIKSSSSKKSNNKNNHNSIFAEKDVYVSQKVHQFRTREKEKELFGDIKLNNTFHISPNFPPLLPFQQEKERWHKFQPAGRIKIRDNFSFDQKEYLSKDASYYKRESSLTSNNKILVSDKERAKTHFKGLSEIATRQPVLKQNPRLKFEEQISGDLIFTSEVPVDDNTVKDASQVLAKCGIFKNSQNRKMSEPKNQQHKKLKFLEHYQSDQQFNILNQSTTIEINPKRSLQKQENLVSKSTRFNLQNNKNYIKHFSKDQLDKIDKNKNTFDEQMLSSN